VVADPDGRTAAEDLGFYSWLAAQAPVEDGEPPLDVPVSAAAALEVAGGATEPPEEASDEPR
jgi:hypothetical protein